MPAANGPKKPAIVMIVNDKRRRDVLKTEYGRPGPLAPPGRGEPAGIVVDAVLRTVCFSTSSLPMMRFIQRKDSCEAKLFPDRIA